MEAAIATETNTTNMEFMDYSEKSFAIFGNTRPFKDTLRALGGRFNKYLNINDNKVPGWIFSKQNSEPVMEFILKANSGETNFDIPTNLNTTGLPTITKPTNVSRYQYVKYKVYRPSDNQTVQLKVDGTTKEGTVVKTETHNDVVDTVYIDFDGQTSLAMICNGRWTIFGYNVTHSIYFK